MSIIVRIWDEYDEGLFIGSTTVESDAELERLSIMASELNCYLEVVE